MKYLCLIYLEEQRLETLAPAELADMEAGCLTYQDALRQNAHLMAVEMLQPVHTATTVRVRNGRVSVTDGPFAETKEQLAGFYLIQARDLNEALRVASKIPPARVGCVEVRPVRSLNTEPLHARAHTEEDNDA